MDALTNNYLVSGWMIVMWAGIGLLLGLWVVILEIWDWTINREARKIIKQLNKEE